MSPDEVSSCVGYFEALFSVSQPNTLSSSPTELPAMRQTSVSDQWRAKNTACETLPYLSVISALHLEGCLWHDLAGCVPPRAARVCGRWAYRRRIARGARGESLV